jgi:hypothetical protein
MGFAVGRSRPVDTAPPASSRKHRRIGRRCRRAFGVDHREPGRTSMCAEASAISQPSVTSPLAANKTRRRLARRRRRSTNDANDAWSQSRVAAGDGIAPRQTSDAPGHRHSCHFPFDPEYRCSAVKPLPDIVARAAGFLFQLADVSRPDPRSHGRSADSRRAFAVILVRVVTSYFFESRRHIAASRR